MPVIPTISGDSNTFSIFPNASKTLEMHCGQKHQDTADTFKVGAHMSPQKYRKVGNSRLPLPRRNSPPMSSHSNHTESDQRWENFPTTKENNESRKLKERISMLPVGSLMPDALAKTSQPPQNGIPCEDRCGTSTTSRHKRKSQDHDVGDHPPHIKLRFNNLIALPLKDLSDPEKETSMNKALSIVADKLSLFSEEQAEQILGLLIEFPALVHNWRECYCQFQMYSQTEKIRDLVENSERDEESLKVRYEELENKEKELMRQLEAVQREKAEIAEERTEKSKQIKDKDAHQNKEERLMRIATTKLNNLSDQWAKLQSFFI